MSLLKFRPDRTVMADWATLVQEVTYSYVTYASLRDLAGTLSVWKEYGGEAHSIQPVLKTASLIPCTLMVHLLLCWCVQVRQAEGARVGWYCQAWPLQWAESLWWGLVLHTCWYASFLSLLHERYAGVELGLHFFFPVGPGQWIWKPISLQKLTAQEFFSKSSFFYLFIFHVETTLFVRMFCETLSNIIFNRWERER